MLAVLQTVRRTDLIFARGIMLQDTSSYGPQKENLLIKNWLLHCIGAGKCAENKFAIGESIVPEQLGLPG